MYIPIYRTITSINEKDLYMVNIVQQSIDKLIRRNDPGINYNIKEIEYEREGTSAGAIVNIPDNGITLHYNLTKTSNSDDYVIDNIEIGCDYFTNISTLDDIFSDAVRFVRDYVNNSDSTDEECEILRFSFDTGEFLVGILDWTKEKTVKRIFSFEIEFDDSDEIQGLKYYGEVTADMVQCNITDF